MRPDPLGLGSARLDYAQSLNRYSYTHNDPVNFIDRNGGEEEEVIDRIDTWEPGEDSTTIGEIFEDTGGKPTKSDGSKGGGGDSSRSQACENAIVDAKHAMRELGDIVVGAQRKNGIDDEHLKKLKMKKNMARKAHQSISSNCNNHQKQKYAELIAELESWVNSTDPEVGDLDFGIQEMKLMALLGGVVGAVGRGVGAVITRVLSPVR